MGKIKYNIPKEERCIIGEPSFAGTEDFEAYFDELTGTTAEERWADWESYRDECYAREKAGKAGKAGRGSDTAVLDGQSPDLLADD